MSQNHLVMMGRKIFRTFTSLFFNKKDMNYLGAKKVWVYFLFQRVFRVNASIPWLVHWSSTVSFPQYIKTDEKSPNLGTAPGQYIQGRNGIEVGANLRIGPGVKIISSNHDFQDYDQYLKTPPVKIGNNCWLAANVVVLPGVELGDHTVVAAGAVVNKSFKEGDCLIGGVPAKKIKDLGPYKRKNGY